MSRIARIALGAIAALDHVEFDTARAEAYEARVSAFFNRYLLEK